MKTVTICVRRKDASSRIRHGFKNKSYSQVSREQIERCVDYVYRKAAEGSVHHQDFAAHQGLEWASSIAIIAKATQDGLLRVEESPRGWRLEATAKGARLARKVGPQLAKQRARWCMGLGA